jgi:hypothetical protein
MRDIFTREERLGLTRTSIPAMIGQGLLLVACIVLMYLILLMLSV